MVFKKRKLHLLGFRSRECPVGERPHTRMSYLWKDLYRLWKQPLSYYGGWKMLR